MNFNKDIENFFELRWHIIFGDLELSPHLVIDIFGLLDALSFPLVLRLASLSTSFVHCLKYHASHLLVLHKLILDGGAQHIHAFISTQVKQNFKLVKHGAICDRGSLVFVLNFVSTGLLARGARIDLLEDLELLFVYFFERLVVTALFANIREEANIL